MPFVSAPSKAEMIKLIDETQERHYRAAFAVDCRVAFRWNIATPGFPLRVEYQFVVLSPGDPLPTGDGWELWENHSGMAVGRPI